MLYLPVAPPGSGKSFLASRMIKAGLITPEAVLSSDEYRRVLSGDPTEQSCTPEAFRIIKVIFEYRIKTGHDVYLDATNVTRRDRLENIAIAKSHGQPVTVIYTSLEPEQILARNSSEHRGRLGTIVPDHAMNKMFARFDSFDVTESDWPTYITMEDFSEQIEDEMFSEYYGVNEYEGV